ncbi:hypothetical protein [Nonomuraea roseoviolacea]|uniref:Uncharacterized protein n=1 Tax=Nonomuraea roseoviolacea subsp. carminata TaxID=160689 RepID=A0ABT1K0C6_9ACTN|nr:hypothetical protein [Nonomuraea roseoviolacea]MCP2346941.1 hypothetical protein [Nonomuraea roseoviolacea subsp. carminata]
MHQPAKSVGRFLPTLFVIGFVFYLFIDPPGAASVLKSAIGAVTTGAHQLAEFIRAASK